ncbi:uncharacterized protein RCC_08000 [Ramularia collo-cygni]|uniref:Uncharacterized protein n=1 Tax=Ramularia collo-cygni TaxID=112498 RepID=A0A2D3UYZ5_9PEZI|nr:uncharacterized protein RCC_08000 [Ramularia collo-cygni]CZT22131.1 uncharacterized protein RCC_08000 [Ramularia collo-cygni]
MASPPSAQDTVMHAEVLPGLVKRGGREYQGYVLRTLEHEPITVTLAAIDFFSRHTSDMLPAQRSAQGSLLRAMENWPRASQTELGLPSPKYMKRIIRDIGCLFFFDTLHDVRFSWGNGTGDYGYYTPSEFYQHHEGRRNDASITVNAEYHNPEKLMVELFGTLLHECCHAFQSKHFCRDSCADMQCIAGLYRVKGSAGDNDYTGHGSSYFILASHVQARARELLQPDIDLGSPKVELTSDFESFGTFPSESHRLLCHSSWRDKILEFCHEITLRNSVELE